jgi:hypothetical protein
MMVLSVNKLVAIVIISLSMQSLQITWAQSTATYPDNQSTTTAPYSNNQNNPGVYPPDSNPYNLTYSDWSGRWVQWLTSIPQDNNPTLDETGKNCAQNQSGPVWFLAASSGGSVVKSCTIPEGKAILLPVITRWEIRTSPADTEADMRAHVKNSIDHVTTLEASIDGTPLQNLWNYRVTSPLFNVTLPKNNLLGVPEGPTEGVSDGYWILVEPLPVGGHTIYLNGAAVDVADPSNNVVITRTWQLTIAPTNATTPSAAGSGQPAAAIANQSTTLQ